MPNWCNNTLVLQHTNPAMITRAAEAIERGVLFEEFAPLGEWDYNLAVEKWSTKWDASNLDVIDRTDNTISVSFDTAWSPPINFYDELLAQGFEVQAEYFEPGVCFVGKYIDGVDDEYSFETADLLEEIPEDLVENWGIREMLEEWDED